MTYKTYRLFVVLHLLMRPLWNVNGVSEENMVSRQQIWNTCSHQTDILLEEACISYVIFAWFFFNHWLSVTDWWAFSLKVTNRPFVWFFSHKKKMVQLSVVRNHTAANRLVSTFTSNTHGKCMASFFTIKYSLNLRSLGCINVQFYGDRWIREIFIDALGQ